MALAVEVPYKYQIYYYCKQMLRRPDEDGKSSLKVLINFLIASTEVPESSIGITNLMVLY
jgi:hypothetical protein